MTYTKEQLMASHAETGPRVSAWLANAPLDLAMAFGWLPFWAWLLTTPVVGDVADAAFPPAFRFALLLALSFSFVHRHFVYVLVFGDAAQRARHPRALWVAPLVATTTVLPARLWAPALFDSIVSLVAAWNIWHTLMQRHGIARAYALKRGGFDARAHGRRDLYTLLALAACTAAFVIMFRQDTFYGRAQRVLGGIHVVLAREYPSIGWSLLVVSGLAAAGMALAWVRAEAGTRPRAARGPRLVFWVSSLCLLGVFVVHGLMVGFLVFGVAHAIEYVLFVYVVSRGRMARGERAPSARVFGRALPLAAVSALLLALYVAARQVWTLPLFVVYYTATSALHFFYDGLIWKLRRPEVRAPIMARTLGRPGV